MPNYCQFEMKLKGEKENLVKAYDIISADYNYKEDRTLECSADKHLFRIFEADYEGKWDRSVDGAFPVKSVEESIDEYGEGNSLLISGSCAWSVYSCMFEGDYTYYNDWNKEERAKYSEFKGTTIQKVSEELKLTIEIFSEEPGCSFMEHYVIHEGEVLISDEIEYKEEYDEILDDYTCSGGIEWKYTI